MTAEDEIRQVLEKRVEAILLHDAASANAHLDVAIVAFEAAGPLQVPSDQVRDERSTQLWLDSFDDGPFVTMEELAVHAEQSVAFCHSLNRLRGHTMDGKTVDVTMRSTVGFRKIEATWTNVHADTSFPR